MAFGQAISWLLSQNLWKINHEPDHKWMFLGGGGTKNAGLKYAAGWMDSMMITAGAAALS